MSTLISAMIVSAACLPAAGDGGEPVPGPSERGDDPVDLGVERGYRRPPGAPGAQGPGARTGRDDPRSGPVALGGTGAAWPAAALGPARRAPGGRAPPPTRAATTPDPRPQHVSGDRVQLDARVFHGLLDPLDLWRCGPGSAACDSGSSPAAPGSGAGGTKPPRNSPCSNSSASQAASQTLVSRPGKILTCRALTNSSSSPRSSSTYQIGLQ